jgi:mono/diheme cytochrome c family protein
MLRLDSRHPSHDMKYHFTLLSLLLIASQSGCSSGDESPDPVTGPMGGSATTGGAPAGTAGTPTGAAGTGTAGTGTAGTGTAGSTAGSGGTSSGGGGSGGSTSVAGQGGSGTGGNAAAGQSGGGAGGSSAGAGGTSGAMDGPSLYLAKCAACHGQQGVGGPLGPEIQHPVRDYSSWVVRHGRAMTSFPAPMLAVPTGELSDSALEKIWDYLDAPAQPTTGQALYLDYCGNCHGADGKGGPTMRNILNELGALKDMVRKGAHPGEFDMRREYMPAFGMDVISNSELDAIYQYVDSL